MSTTLSETARDYIAYAERNPSVIDAQQYRRMLIQHFETMGPDAGDVLQIFYDVALANRRLQSTFYAALKSAFTGLQSGSRASARRWNNAMNTLITLSRTDPTIATYITRDLMGQLPGLLGHKDTSYADYQAASDIMVAVGKENTLSQVVRPDLAHRVVKWHLHLLGNDFVHAASRLTELRDVAPFVPEIASIENGKGLHVHGEPLNQDPKQTLVLRFDRARARTEVYIVNPSTRGHHHHPDEIMMDGAETPHRDQLANLLLRQAEETLPQQEWVSPLATNAYCAIA